MPKSEGKYLEIEKDPEELTVMRIADRVRENKEFYELKVIKKMSSEGDYYENKTYVQE